MNIKICSFQTWDIWPSPLPVDFIDYAVGGVCEFHKSLLQFGGFVET